LREPQHKSNGSNDHRVGEKTLSHQTPTPTYVSGKNGRKTNPQCENQTIPQSMPHDCEISPRIHSGVEGFSQETTDLSVSPQALPKDEQPYISTNR